VDPGWPACILGRMRAVKKWTLGPVILGSGGVFVESSIVAASLPKIGDALPIPRGEETRAATVATPCAQSPGIEASAEAGS
jgi:hypothetical protein